MSLLDKYGVISTFKGTHNDHMREIYSGNRGYVSYPVRPCFSEHGESCVNTNIEDIDSNEMYGFVDRLVKITIDDVDLESKIKVMITIDTYLNTLVDIELLRWILSFQTKFGVPWKRNFKKYVRFDTDKPIDFATEQEAFADYVEMVGNSCQIESSGTSIKAEPWTAKYHNFMRWVEYINQKYDLELKQVPESDLIRFKATMCVDHAYAGLNDLFIDYGYNWLEHSGIKIEPEMKIEVDTRDINILHFQLGPHSTDYNWMTNEFSVYGLMLPVHRCRSELIRKKDDDVEGCNALWKMLSFIR